MRILFIGGLPEPITGQSVACQVLYDALTPDHEVDVVNLSKPDIRNGVSSFGRVWHILRIIGAVWLKVRRTDRIYFTISESVAGNLKDLLIYLVCWRKLDVMLVHLHGGANLRHILRGRLRGLNAFFLKRVGGVVALGPTHRVMFDGIVPAHRLHMVPNFAPPDLFVTNAQIDAKFAETTTLRVIYLSNLIPGKGYEELLSALAAMDYLERARFHVDIAGAFESDAARQDALFRIARLPNVHYHGVVRGEVKRRLLQQAHVFVLPTYYAYEGTPISILEAYAAGCAVITTDHSGINDIFTDGVHGIQVPPRELLAVKVALHQAARTPEWLCQAARHNRREAAERYQLTRHTTALAALIGGLGRLGREGGVEQIHRPARVDRERRAAGATNR